MGGRVKIINLPIRKLAEAVSVSVELQAVSSHIKNPGQLVSNPC
jgi:hypothetical protein